MDDDLTQLAVPDVWAAQSQLSRQLAAWSAASIAAGTALALRGRGRDDRDLRAFGGQNAAWGGIDLVIAGVGEVRRRRRQASLDRPLDPDVQAREWRTLRRVLLLNAALDVGYVALGLAAVRRGRASPSRRGLAGHGAAVVLQGGFLLVFDAVHARRAGRAVRGAGQSGG